MICHPSQKKTPISINYLFLFAIWANGLVFERRICLQKVGVKGGEEIIHYTERRIKVMVCLPVSRVFLSLNSHLIN